MFCCGYTLTDFPIPIRLTSLALWQSNDCPSASKTTLMNMDKYFMWIMNDCITTTKQSTTKPCAYFLGYTVHLTSHHGTGIQSFDVFSVVSVIKLLGKGSRFAGDFTLGEGFVMIRRDIVDVSTHAWISKSYWYSSQHQAYGMDKQLCPLGFVITHPCKKTPFENTESGWVITVATNWACRLNNE